jgi:outer membrane lipoprotein-sorting protein
MGIRLPAAAWASIGLLSAAWIQPAAEAFHVSYEQQVTVGGHTTVSQVAIKDASFRIESDHEGIRSILMRNDSGIYHYVPDQQIAMKLPALDPSQQLVDDLETYVDFLQERNATLIRTETVRGMACDVYQFLEPGKRRNTTAWIWKDKQFLIKLEVSSPQGQVTTELHDIDFTTWLQDSEFEVPPGVEIMKLGDINMRGLMQGLEERQ